MGSIVMPAERRLTPGAVSPEAVSWAAEQTMRMHTEGQQHDRAAGRCAKCPDDPAECQAFRWARRVLLAFEEVGR